MQTLIEVASFVKDQASFHERKAASYASINPRRSSQHELLCQQFKALADFVAAQAECVDKLEDELDKRPLPPPLQPRQLSLRPEDIEGLPDELMQQLSITDGDRIDFTIQTLMNERGGVVSLDHLLIALFRKLGEVHKRTDLNARMYRLTKKGAVYSVPGRKGIYALRELTEEESSALDRSSGDGIA